MNVIIKHPGNRSSLQNIDLDLYESLKDLIDTQSLRVAVRCHDMWPDHDLVIYQGEQSDTKPVNFYRISDQLAIRGDVVAVKYNNINLNEIEMTQAEAEVAKTLMDTWSTYSKALDEVIN